MLNFILWSIVAASYFSHRNPSQLFFRHRQWKFIVLSTSWALKGKADKLLYLTEHTHFRSSPVQSPELRALGNTRQGGHAHSPRELVDREGTYTQKHKAVITSTCCPFRACCVISCLWSHLLAIKIQGLSRQVLWNQSAHEEMRLEEITRSAQGPSSVKEPRFEHLCVHLPSFNPLGASSCPLLSITFLFFQFFCLKNLPFLSLLSALHILPDLPVRMLLSVLSSHTVPHEFRLTFTGHHVKCQTGQDSGKWAQIPKLPKEKIILNSRNRDRAVKSSQNPLCKFWHLSHWVFLP